MRKTYFAAQSLVGGSTKMVKLHVQVDRLACGHLQIADNTSLTAQAVVKKHYKTGETLMAHRI